MDWMNTGVHLSAFACFCFLGYGFFAAQQKLRLVLDVFSQDQDFSKTQNPTEFLKQFASLFQISIFERQNSLTDQIQLAVVYPKIWYQFHCHFPITSIACEKGEHSLKIILYLSKETLHALQEHKTRFGFPWNEKLHAGIRLVGGDSNWQLEIQEKDGNI